MKGLKCTYWALRWQSLSVWLVMAIQMQTINTIYVYHLQSSRSVYKVCWKYFLPFYRTLGAINWINSQDNSLIKYRDIQAKLNYHANIIQFYQLEIFVTNWKKVYEEFFVVLLCFMFDRQTVLTMSGKYFEIFFRVGGLVLIINILLIHLISTLLNWNLKHQSV